MNRLGVLALVAALLVTVTVFANTDDRVRFNDIGTFHTNTGEADIDVSAADYTSSQALLTITPNDNHAMHDVKVFLDLDKTTTGLDDVDVALAGFGIARKVDGTNWRLDIASVKTSTYDYTPAGGMLSLDLGTILPTEDARIEVVLDAEVADVEIPYSVYYRSGATATFTPVAN